MRPSRLRLVCLLVTILVTGAPTAGSAQEGPGEEGLPVRISADSFRYDRRTRVLVATGNVVLVYRDVTIRSDELVANLETGDVTAEGHVQLSVGEQSATAELLTYNLDSRFGTLLNARSEYSGPYVLGSVHLRAARLEGVPDRFAAVRDGFVTTCDERDPLVYFTAEEIAIFLNDRIVGRRVSLWLAGRRIVTLPFFLIFLRERRESPLTPVVGYTEAEGWFVKTTYNYVVNDNHYGFLHLDWMERLGVGVGIEHLYQTGVGQGSAFVYRTENRQTGGSDLRAVVNHAHEITPEVRIQVYGDYTQRTAALTPTTTDLFLAADVNRRTERSSTFLFSTLSTSTVGPQTNLAALVFHNQALAPGLWGEVALNLFRVDGPLGRDEEALPRLTLRYAHPDLSATLVTEARWDLDGDRFTGDARYTLERLPELTVSLAPFRLGGTGLVGYVEGGLGYFRETLITGPPVQGGRAYALATLAGGVPLGGGSVNLNAFARSDLYATGSARLFAGGRVEYIRPVTPELELRVGYTVHLLAGSTPFQFDRIAETLHSADAQLTYRTAEWFVRTTVSYDIRAREFGNVVAQAVYLPRPGWALAVAADYNLRAGRLDRLEATADLRLSPEWHVQYVGIYEGSTRRFIHDRVSVTRVFCDCLAVSLSYLGARGELWLETWLTAIPWGRGRIGIGGQGNLLFEQPPSFFGTP